MEKRKNISVTLKSQIIRIGIVTIPQEPDIEVEVDILLRKADMWYCQGGKMEFWATDSSKSICLGEHRFFGCITKVRAVDIEIQKEIKKLDKEDQETDLKFSQVPKEIEKIMRGER